MQILDTLPEWEQYIKGATPGAIPAWSGDQPPPAIGDRVYIRMNECGLGTVTAYAVDGGFLGVMVKLDERTRPEWHKKQNPNNDASIVFGAELGEAHFAVTGRVWGDEEDTAIVYHTTSDDAARANFITDMRALEDIAEEDFDSEIAQVFVNSVCVSAAPIHLI